MSTTWTLPDGFERCIEEATEDVVGAIEPARLIRAILARSERYTSARDELGNPALDPAADLAARARFFAVADAPKVMVPLAELYRLGCFGGDCESLISGLEPVPWRWGQRPR